MSAQNVVFAAALVLRIVNQGIYDSCLLKHKGRHRVSVHEFIVHSQLNTIHTILVSCVDLHLVVGVNATVKASCNDGGVVQVAAVLAFVEGEHFQFLVLTVD